MSILWRLTGVILLLSNLVCWLLAAMGIYAQFAAGSFSLAAFALSMFAIAGAVWTQTMSQVAFMRARQSRYRFH